MVLKYGMEIQNHLRPNSCETPSANCVNNLDKLILFTANEQKSR